MPVDVVRMGIHHVPEMADLEKLCFSLPWTTQMIREEFNNPIATYWVAQKESRLIGYAGLQAVIDEGYITNIAVDPAFRRQGVAKKLLKALIFHAVERRLSFVTLEVRVSNKPAVALYESFGFTTVGLRRGYYHKPREDALLMTCYLESSSVGTDTPSVREERADAL